ncbi:MAG: amidohydrolase family protein [Planctomycetes bacterium]|nr:amidohydrolase family protein [Planctomycetota bacterium]
MIPFGATVAAFLPAFPPAGAADVTVIAPVAVIDVVSGRAVPDQAVVIEGEKIAAVSSSSSFTAPPGATRIDGTGKFLLPGLFDAHVHYVDTDTFGPLCLANGVVFVRDMGNATEVILSTRNRLNRGDLLGPEMICTGNIVDGKPPVWPFSEACDTPEEGRAAVRKLRAAAVDQIKVYSRLKKEVYEAVVAEAKAVGLPAVGHIPESCTIDDAIAAGQASNEHMMAFGALLDRLAPPSVDRGQDWSGGLWPSGRFWFLYPKVDKAALATELRRIAESGMVQCPTLVVSAGIANAVGKKGDADPRMAYVPASLRSFWAGDKYEGFGRFMKAAGPHMKDMVGDMARAGVPMMVGTDLANPYVFAGFSVHDEIGNLVEAGLSPAEALRAATTVPARFCGVDRRLGTIEAGKVASMVLLGANPLEDVGNTRKIDSVWLRGRRFDRAALDGLLVEAMETVAADEPAGETKVALDLPGEVILRGTYAVKFGPFPAGTEDFLITETADGYEMMAHNKPQGGPQSPFVVTCAAGPDFAFRKAAYRQDTKTPVDAEYVLEGGSLKATAKRGEKALEPQSLSVAPGDAVGTPAYASAFLTLNRLKMRVGETREIRSVSFGYPDWKPQAAPLKVERKEDVDLARPGGATTKARLFKRTLSVENMTFSSDTWTDERGIVLKTVMTMPFGQLIAELQP